MGYCWYLRRDDNRTLFELGKGVANWMAALGDGAPIVLGPEHESALADVLAKDLANWSRSLPDGAVGYARHVAKAIITWCNGHPFRFIGEDGYDDWVMDDTFDTEQAITGTLHVYQPSVDAVDLNKWTRRFEP
jgi:hypothetical protein